MSEQEKSAYDIYTFGVTSDEVTIKVTGTVPTSIIHAGTAYVPLRATNKLWHCYGVSGVSCVPLTQFDWGKTGELPAAEQKTADEVKAMAALQTEDGLTGSAGCVVTKNSLPNRIYDDISASTPEGDAWVHTFGTNPAVTYSLAGITAAVGSDGLFATSEDGCDQAAAEITVKPCVVPPTTPPTTPPTPPTTPPTVPPTTPPTEEKKPKETPKSKTPKAEKSEALATTGSDVATIAFGAVMLLALGGVSLAGARKQR